MFWYVIGAIILRTFMMPFFNSLSAPSRTTRAYRPREPAMPMQHLFTGQDTSVFVVGGEVILKVVPEDRCANEAPTLDFLEGLEWTILPIPRCLRSWIKSGYRYIMQDRIPGAPLSDVWGSLDRRTRWKIARQVAGAVRNWRKIKGPFMSAVDGGEASMPIVGGFTDGEGLSLPCLTDNDFWKRIQPLVAHAPRALQEVMRFTMPTCEPWTFTHSDLHVHNIMVQDGNLSGIIDFERAAFYPSWYEFTELHVLCCGARHRADQEWKAMLLDELVGDIPDGTLAEQWVKAVIMMADEPAEALREVDPLELERSIRLFG